MPYVSDTSYLAIKPETTDGTAVIPTVYVPLVSESIRSVVNHTPDNRMKGLSWSADDMLRGVRQHEGELVVLADSTTLAHLLNMTYTKGTTTGSATGYTHPFTVGDPDSYTIEIKTGPYARRYFGVKVDELVLSFNDGKLEAKVSIKAKGMVGVMSLGIATSGAVTQLTLSDAYDEEPTRGLVAGDQIVIGSTTLTLLTVTATTVTFTSTSITASVGDPIYLKAQTSTIPSLPEPFMLGQVLVGVGADESAATTAAGSRATATPVYDLEMTFRNNLFVANGTQRHDPAAIYPQKREAEVKLSQLFETVAQEKAWLTRAKQAITVIITGRYIDIGTGTRNSFTCKFHNVKLMENASPLKSGELISYEQQFTALYDSSDAKALTLSVVNPTASTAY